MPAHARATHPITGDVEVPTFMRPLLPVACAVALAVAFMVALQRPTRAADAPPPVPAAIEVPAGQKLFFVGRATGTQNYVCQPSGSEVKFVLFTPQATLFDGGEQATTHY